MRHAHVKWNHMYLTLKALNYFCIKHGNERVLFNLNSSLLSYLALFDLFEYLLIFVSFEIKHLQIFMYYIYSIFIT